MKQPQEQTHSLDPMPPAGSVYFSQAHSLRWMESGGVDPSLFYREILAHALFFDSLVISDSYVIFNWLLKEMLPQGRFYHQNPGIEELFRSGVVRIARRKGASLEDIARDLIRRQIPVMVEGRLEKAREDFLPHAKRLAQLSEGKDFTYDTKDIKLADRIINDILEVDDVLEAYGLSKELRDETLCVVNRISHKGTMYAAELFYYPETYSSGLLAQNIGLIQKLATSAHSCTFPVTFGLIPVVSPNSDDHRGATAFYERFAPEVKCLADKEDELLVGTVEPLNLVLTQGSNDFTLRGVDPILALRASDEFRKLQKARSNLLGVYRTLSTITPSHQQAYARRAEEQMQEVQALYLGLVAEKYELGEPIGEASSRSLQSLIAKASRQIEETRDVQARNRWIFAAVIVSVAAALVKIGVPAHVTSLAVSTISTAAYLRQRNVMERLTNNRRMFENAGRLLNLRRASEAIDKPSLGQVDLKEGAKGPHNQNGRPMA